MTACVPHSPRATTRSCGKAAVPAACPGPAEGGGVGVGVRHVDGRAVDADQPPVPVERPRRGRGRQRHARPVEQLRQRLRPKPGPGLGDRDLRGHREVLRAVGGPRQPLGQAAHHLLITGRGEQRHRQHVVDRQMRRQQPVALLTPPGHVDDLIYQLARERRGQHPQCHPVTEPLTRLDPHLPGPWHTTKNTTRVVLSYGYCG